MAAQIGSLFVSLTADVQPFVQGMTRAQTTTTQATTNITRQAGVAEGAVKKFWGSAENGGKFNPYSYVAVSRAFENAADRASLLRGSLLAASGVLTGFVGALSTNVVLRYADTYVNLSNQLRVVSADAADASSRLSAIADVAQSTRSGLEATALLYTRIQKAAPDRSAEEVLQYVSTIQKALQLGGATAQEARSAAIQFSQAIASNRLSGDEIRAILETPLGLELARGLGITIGKLREMGTEGKLTADVILGGLSKIAGTIDDQFSRSILTVDQALVQLDNNLAIFFGELNKSYGVTRLLAQGISSIGDNLNTILPLVATFGTAIAAAFVGKKLSTAGGGILSAIQKDATDAKERVIGLRDQLTSLEKTRNDAFNTQASLIRAPTSQFADPALRKAAERAEQDYQKSLERSATALGKVREAQQALGSVTSQVSPRAIKLADDLAAAEGRVTQNLQRQGEVRRGIAQAKTTEIGALGLQSTNTGKLSAVSEAARARAALERESVNIEKAILRDKEQIAAKEIQISTLQSAADQKAVEERLAAARKLNDVKAVYDQSLKNVGGSKAASEEAQRRMSLSGDLNSKQAIADQTGQIRQLSAALAPLPAQLEAAARAATPFGMAGTWVKNSWSSLLGLFGGGWGIAITGGIMLLTQLGAQAAKTASDIAQAQALIQEGLKRRMAAAGGSEGTTGTSRQDSLLSNRIEATKKELDKVQAYYNKIMGDIESGRSISRAGTGGADRAIIDIQNSITDTVKEFATGNIAVDEFRSRLNAIQEANPAFQKLIELARQNGAELFAAADQARAYKDQLKQLEEQRGVGTPGLIGPVDNPEKRAAYQSIAAEAALLQLRGDAYDVEKKVIELKKQYPALSDEELRSSATMLTQLEKVKVTYQQAAEAARSLAEEAARAEQAKSYSTLTNDNDVLQAYQNERLAIGEAANNQEVYTRAREKFMSLQKQGSGLTFEEILQQEQLTANVRLSADAYKALGDAAIAAGEAAQKASYDALVSSNDFYANIRNKINQTLLEAKGKKVEARAQEIYLQGPKDDPKAYDTALELAKQEDAANKLKDSFEKAGRETQSFADKLARLKESAQGAFLGDVDRAVVDQARGLKAAASDIKAYVDAAKTGDFSGVSKPIMDIQTIELLKAAGAEYRNIVQKYGDWSQIAPMAEQEQQKLNLAVEKGSINAYQAQIAYADFLSGFQNYAWIKSTSDALAQFATDAMMDFTKIDDAFDTLAKSLMRTAIQEITNPLNDAFRVMLTQVRGYMSGLMPGGGGGGGGGVPYGPQLPTVSPGGDMAPSISGDMAPSAKDMAAYGERTFARTANFDTSRPVADYAQKVGTAPPGININVHDKVGNKVTASEGKRNGGGFDIDLMLDKKTGKSLRRPGSDANRAVTDSFGIQQQTQRR